MWKPSRRCGDDRDDTGMIGGRRGWHGDHGDNMEWRPRRQRKPRRPQPWRPHGDLLGAMGMMWGWRGWHGDDVGTTWGQRGDHGDNEITKNAITFEWIEIIEFRLKIWDPWTLPHTCRLQLMCRWGVFYPKCHFYPKSAPVTLEKFFFPVFALDPIRPYLDWALRGFFDLLTHLRPIEIAAEMKTKCKIWLKCQFSHTTINHRKILNAPLDALMCPLQIINWHWTLIVDPSWCKRMLYPPPIQCRKLLDQP